MKRLALFILPFLALGLITPVFATDLPYNQTGTCYGAPITGQGTFNCFWSALGTHSNGDDGFGNPHDWGGVMDSEFIGLTATSISFLITAIVTIPIGSGATCAGASFTDGANVDFGVIDTTTGVLVASIGSIAFSSISAHLCYNANIGVSTDNDPVLITLTGNIVVGVGQGIGIKFPSTDAAGYNHYVSNFCSGNCDGMQLTSPNSGIFAGNCGPNPCQPGYGIGGNIVFSAGPIAPTQSAVASAILPAAFIMIIAGLVYSTFTSKQFSIQEKTKVAIGGVIAIGLIFVVFLAVGL